MRPASDPSLAAAPPPAAECQVVRLEPAPLPDPVALAGEQMLAYRRRTLVFAALLVASCYLIDLFQPRLAEVAAVRAAWIAAILLTAALQRPERGRLATFASYAGSTLTGVAVVAIVALDGGTASIYAGMLIATPFAVLVAMAELPLAAALNGAILVAGGAAIRLGEGQPAEQIVSWLLLSTVMTALATWGTVAARRAWRTEVAAEQARRRAQEALAESERQRVEAEGLAEVGRLAAQVAHEVNNPLAVVKANVQWLGQPEAIGDERERAEVVADTLLGVERIVEAVSALRRSAGERPFNGR
jgi:signal transduction histidine kinase